ncbi:precorrin-6A synthase (deacetylating) [Ancylobacter novellus DSM 506]|uniref:Precorrin-6A synthase [deacetylating] n=1 Tax=Ancylobacter novellus (strain ATCC 8093 / DSM 506 / JCM 20403 / CCM 1077 / IAM 12100 / NBRC 12443 / NCIMB 10456) TaxID=639283 RepID=D6ZZ17_ANCN5|nr:precorrin-6A synthase (deacetylating) [Ancylobacter novellus]ADH91136.1 precorrin-6A synthase (deacetylating) [Ancylobacter novellus DSM 506]
MTRRLLVIGIGAGAPGHLTLQAIEAINRAEVFFLLDKSEAAAELVAAREAILKAHRRAPWRVARLASPKRRAEAHIHGGARTPARETTYRADVADWHSARAALLAPLIEAELPEDGVGALLVWGDPALYDSTLRVLEAVRATLPLAIEVVPGISAVQALTTAHGLVLNEVGAKVVLTTGRRVLEDFSREGTTVVMLDDGTGLAALIAREAEVPPAGAAPLHIWWGAYLGMEGELLMSGPLAQVGPQILRQRAEAREKRGWIMDVWLVREPKF